MGVRWRGGGKSMMRQDGWDGMRVGDHSMDGVGQNGERSDCGWDGITGDRWDRMGWE